MNIDDFDKEEFMKLHNAIMLNIKMECGKVCKDVRTRNGFSREYVEFEMGITERSIFKIEQSYDTSIDLVNRLYRYYEKLGLITAEEKERCRIERFFEQSLHTALANPQLSQK